MVQGMGGKPEPTTVPGYAQIKSLGKHEASPMARPSIAAAHCLCGVKLATREANPKSKAILAKLEEPISMSFNEATPLEDVLKYIKQATTSKTYQGIQIYVDPKGLEEAQSTMTSRVHNMDIEGVPLKTSLRLILKQLDLAYCVRDGVLIISSVEGIRDELMEAEREINIKESLDSKDEAQRRLQ